LAQFNVTCCNFLFRASTAIASHGTDDVESNDGLGENKNGRFKLMGDKKEKEKMEMREIRIDFCQIFIQNGLCCSVSVPV